MLPPPPFCHSEVRVKTYINIVDSFWEIWSLCFSLGVCLVLHCSVDRQFFCEIQFFWSFNRLERTCRDLLLYTIGGDFRVLFYLTSEFMQGGGHNVGRLIRSGA